MVCRALEKYRIDEFLPLKAEPQHPLKSTDNRPLLSKNTLFERTLKTRIFLVFRLIHFPYSTNTIVVYSLMI